MRSKIYLKNPPWLLQQWWIKLHKIPAWIGLLLLPVAAITQPNITRVEWYVDIDPGYGNASPISISAGPNLTNLSFSVNLVPLSEGVHIAAVRSRDANGSWSHDNKWLFVKPYVINANTPVPNINRVEWYIDTDPGYGNATPIAISPGANLTGLSFSTNIPPLFEGVHIVGARSRDVNGSWSHDNKWLFVRPYNFNSIQVPNITKVEWYLDKDPGYGNATQIAVSPGTNLSNLSFSQNVSGLSPGVHIIGVRSKDANGAWSVDNKWLFIKAYPSSGSRLITRMEYYIDTDPGYGKAVQLAVMPATNIPAKETFANISGISAGKHYVYFRSKDTLQAWSFDYKDSFDIAAPIPAPQIVINSTAKKTMCVRDSFYVGYDITGTYNAGNTFKVFLSNAAGDFAAETEIGSKTATTDGLIRCTLPQNLPDGNGYKIRLKSSNPVLTSVVPTFSYTLFDRPFFGNDTTVFAVCGTDLFDLNAIYPGTNFKLNWNTLNPDAADTGTYRLIAVNGNGCSDTVKVTVKQDIGTWKGTTNSDWHTASNWTNNHVPTAKSHAIIVSGTPNNCIISATDAVAASIQVKPGATLNVTNSHKVNIAASCNALPN